MVMCYWILAVTYFVTVFANSLLSISPYETVQAIRSEGYVGEAHRVTTTDGYILEMHRIPYRRHEITGSPDRPVVFVMHGLTAASNTFVMLGPETAIAYNLADAGFDVWMGNARGTRNSRYHVSLNPDSRQDRHEFFDFTWDEIGLYDISAMVDYVLSYTNNKKLHYIGHSQGGTVFLVLNSLRPEYNEKFASAHFLAGVGYKDHFPHILLGPLAMFTNTLYNLATNIGLVELLPPSNRTLVNTKKETWTPDDYCQYSGEQKQMCHTFMSEFIVNGILDDLTWYQPGGASFKQVAHYGQNIQNKIFRRWDYGSLGNFQKYGSVEPPIYDISQITVNLTMHYTVSDTLLDERDVYAMAAAIPNTSVRRVARESFLHSDFVMVADVKDLVTDYIIEAMWTIHNSDQTVPTPDPVVEPATGASSNVVLSFVFKMYLIITSFYFIAHYY